MTRLKTNYHKSWWCSFIELRVSLTWKSALRSGRCRFSTSGVFEPLTGSGDRQTAKNGHDCGVELLLASNISDNKPHGHDFHQTPAAPALLARRTRQPSPDTLDLAAPKVSVSRLRWASRARVWWAFGRELIFPLLTELISLLCSVQMSQTQVGESYVADQVTTTLADWLIIIHSID